MKLKTLLERLLHNSTEQWTLALAAGAATILVLWFFKAVVVSRLRVLSKRTRTPFDDVLVAALERTKWFTYIILGIYASSHLLRMPRVASRAIVTATVLIVLLQIGIWVRAGVRHG